MIQDIEVRVYWHGKIQAVERLSQKKRLVIGQRLDCDIQLYDKTVENADIVIVRNGEKANVALPKGILVSGTENKDSQSTLVLPRYLPLVLSFSDWRIEIGYIVVQKQLEGWLQKDDQAFRRVLIACFTFQAVFLLGLNLTTFKEASPEKKEVEYKKVAFKFPMKSEAKVSSRGSRARSIQKKVKPKTARKAVAKVNSADQAKALLSKLGLNRSNNSPTTNLKKIRYDDVLLERKKLLHNKKYGGGLAKLEAGRKVGRDGSFSVGGKDVEGFSGGSGLGLGGERNAHSLLVQGKVVYEGSLTKTEIQRVVDRFLVQIKYCYEKEFQKKPSLKGKILVNWVIGNQGEVSSALALENTMNNAQVERCVLRIVKQMSFPKPRGGGIVKVNYPFLFSQAGA